MVHQHAFSKSLTQIGYLRFDQDNNKHPSDNQRYVPSGQDPKGGVQTFQDTNNAGIEPDRHNEKHLESLIAFLRNHSRYVGIQVSTSKLRIVLFVRHLASLRS